MSLNDKIQFLNLQARCTQFEFKSSYIQKDLTGNSNSQAETINLESLLQ